MELVLQGSVTNSTYTTFTNGYFGFAATHSTASAARIGAEFDQLYFDVSASSPMGKRVINVHEITNEKIAPVAFAIEQNYPNPFNPATAFTFTVAEEGNVSLRIFDELGREVAILTNEYYQHGTYTIKWDASNFTSGMYFYRMTAGNGRFVQTKKLLLVE